MLDQIDYLRAIQMFINCFVRGIFANAPDNICQQSLRPGAIPRKE